MYCVSSQKSQGGHTVAAILRTVPNKAGMSLTKREVSSAYIMSSGARPNRTPAVITAKIMTV